MSNEERQRILREAGHRPAESEKERGARSGKEALGRQEGERRRDQRKSPDEPAPPPEDDPSRPVPRR
jgi:hypothetical protein